MQSKHVESPDFIIRPLETSAERDAYYLLAIQTFSPHVDAVAALPHRRSFVETSPTFQARQLRGAFVGNTFLGAYHIDERLLRIGPARVLTGCIASVVTISAHRKQGVAAALLRDAVLFYAQKHTNALLLLDGIADFYHRSGFIDVFDVVTHSIESKDILAQSSSPYSVRSATFEDIPALFELHQRHYGSYAGSFERDKAFQELLFHGRGGMKPYLAVDGKGISHGYLMLYKLPEKLLAYEVTADDWYAALALLQYHVALTTERHGERPTEISWPLPPDSSTFYLLADHLSLRSQVTHRPNADWMARAGHIPTLIDALLPLWNERWQRSSPVRSGVLALTIENVPLLLGADGVGIHLLDPMTSSAHAARHITISQQIFTQLLFGYRPISWAAKQPGQVIPEDLHPVLDILFPKTQAWIAGSDAF
ncbi:MAG: hypothetical protein NVS4B11_09640 [Ktedonobacteraceae bacterium]